LDPQSRKISELLDMLDRIREELLIVQNSLESLEKADRSARTANFPEMTGDGNDGVE
jgi:hypothetical protein